MQVIVTWEYDQTAQASSGPEYYWTKIYVPAYGYIGISSIFTFDTILVDVGDWYELTLEIGNFGNVDTHVELVVLDIPDDVEMVLNDHSFDLNSHQTKIVYGKLKQKEGGSKEFTFRIKADSDLPVEDPDRIYSFRVRTNDRNRIEENFPTTAIVVVFFVIFLAIIAAFILILRLRKKVLREETVDIRTSQDLP